MSYAAGASYTSNAAITLYAVWEVAYIAPRITSVSVDRCVSDTDKTPDDLGTSANIKFNWACDENVTSITIKWKLTTASSYPSENTENVSASNKSGKVDVAFGNNALNTEYAYNVQIVVADSKGSTTTTITLSGAKYLIDLLSSGEGIAFGKPASLAGYADFGFKVKFSDEAFANGCKLATNKILWTGVQYMNSAQTANLSEAISSQANGIVLVWSYYENEAAADQYWNTIFVPKEYVTVKSGNGLSIRLSGTPRNALTLGIKYVYITDTSIIGYANNDESYETTSSGISIYPSSFVLRYVIGV